MLNDALTMNDSLTSTKSKSNKIMIIVLSIVGALFVIMIIVVAVICYKRENR